MNKLNELLSTITVENDDIKNMIIDIYGTLDLIKNQKREELSNNLYIVSYSMDENYSGTFIEFLEI